MSMSLKKLPNKCSVTSLGHTASQFPKGWDWMHVVLPVTLSASIHGISVQTVVFIILPTWFDGKKIETMATKIELLEGKPLSNIYTTHQRWIPNPLLKPLQRVFFLWLTHQQFINGVPVVIWVNKIYLFTFSYFINYDLNFSLRKHRAQKQSKGGYEFTSRDYRIHSRGINNSTGNWDAPICTLTATLLDWNAI